jgi:hypothetical protein
MALRTCHFHSVFTALIALASLSGRCEPMSSRVPSVNSSSTPRLPLTVYARVLRVPKRMPHPPYSKTGWYWRASYVTISLGGMILEYKGKKRRCTPSDRTSVANVVVYANTGSPMPKASQMAHTTMSGAGFVPAGTPRIICRTKSHHETAAGTRRISLRIMK